MQVQFSWERNRQSEQSFNSKQPNEIVISDSIHFRPSKLKLRRLNQLKKENRLECMSRSIYTKVKWSQFEARLFEAGFTLYFCDAFWTAV